MKTSGPNQNSNIHDGVDLIGNPFHNSTERRPMKLFFQNARTDPCDFIATCVDLSTCDFIATLLPFESRPPMPKDSSAKRVTSDALSQSGVHFTKTFFIGGLVKASTAKQ